MALINPYQHNIGISLAKDIPCIHTQVADISVHMVSKTNMKYYTTTL